jgi:AbrB family looped-hinge helix DNA binding protein
VEARVKINPSGRIVIPASFREALGVETGDEIVLRMENEELRITTQRQRIQKAQRLLANLVGPERSLSDELIAERRKAAKNE